MMHYIVPVRHKGAVDYVDLEDSTEYLMSLGFGADPMTPWWITFTFEDEEDLLMFKLKLDNKYQIFKRDEISGLKYSPLTDSYDHNFPAWTAISK